jgi:uncharacterized protein
MDKGYAAQLRQKRQVFTSKTKTRKSIFFTFLSVYGAKTNEHYLGTIQGLPEIATEAKKNRQSE